MSEVRHAPSTVGDLVARAAERLAAAGTSSPRLDAELLLGFALGVDRVTVIASPDALVGSGQAEVFASYVDRRAAGEPVAYIRGFREFHGQAIATDSRALVPRPETELLVEAAIAEVVGRLTAAPRPPGTPPIRVADVGTGTGAIAIALLADLRRRGMDRHVVLVAVDVSPDALDLARENAASHALADRMRFRAGDLLPIGDEPYQLICANLPYVATAELERLGAELGHEPALALDGGSDGLDVIRRLLEILPKLLVPGDGVALLEIGADQGTAIVDAVTALLPGWTCQVQPDLAGHPRLARIAHLPSAGAVDGPGRARA